MASSRRIVIEFLGKDKSLGSTSSSVERKTSKLGDTLKTVGKVGAAALIAGTVAAGKALFDIGQTIDGAYDTIRVGTGATGKALEGLQGDFKEVAKTVPSDMADVGTAIADINTRLGLTGKPLQSVTRQMLDMSRITGTDLTTNIEKVTRVFGDWGVKTRDMSGHMDKLYRASQATGLPVDRLADSMTKFGSPLRQLGFDFDTTAALLGKFEKEGVNADLVMGSMRIALGKMAREGEPAQETLARVTEQIANAGDASSANAIALELFGAKAGPDMAAAIREGRFEVADLVDTIAKGSETIAKSSEDTEDFGEKWAKLKNRVFIALEPLAMRLFDAVGNGLDWVTRAGERAAPTVMRLAGWFRDDLWPALKKVGTILGEELTKALDEVRTALGITGDSSDGFKAALKAMGDILVNFVLPFVGKFYRVYLPALTKAVTTVIKVVMTLTKWWATMVEIGARMLGKLLDGVLRFSSGALRAIAKVVGVFDKDMAAAIRRGADNIDRYRDGAVARLNNVADGAKNVRVAIDRIPNKSATKFSSPGLDAILGKVVDYRTKLDGLDGKVVQTYIATEYKTSGRPMGGGLEARAAGGPVSGGNPYLVGEEGPELFVPSRSGKIIDASTTARMATRGGGGASDGEVARFEIPVMLDGKVVQRSLLTLKRRNGGLELGIA